MCVLIFIAIFIFVFVCFVTCLHVHVYVHVPFVAVGPHEILTRMMLSADQHLNCSLNACAFDFYMLLMHHRSRLPYYVSRPVYLLIVYYVALSTCCCAFQVVHLYVACCMSKCRRELIPVSYPILLDWKT